MGRRRCADRGAGAARTLSSERQRHGAGRSARGAARRVPIPRRSSSHRCCSPGSSPAAARGGWYFVALVLALSTREDVALLVFMLGFVLAVLYWRSDARRDLYAALGTMFIGFAWYLICTQLVIPYFNDGRQAFYLEYFYGSYGGTFPEIAQTMALYPDQPRARRHPAGPIAVLPLPPLAVGLVATGGSARAADGTAAAARQRHREQPVREVDPLPVHGGDDRADHDRRVARADGGCGGGSGSCVSGSFRGCWCGPTRRTWRGRRRRSAPATTWHGCQRTRGRCRSRPRSKLCRTTLPSPRTYGLLPHLSHREQIYNWPNPFVMSYWGNDDDYRLPLPATIEYVVVDRQQVGATEQQLLADLIDGDPYEILFDQEDVVVARRVSPDT